MKVEVAFSAPAPPVALNSFPFHMNGRLYGERLMLQLGLIPPNPIAAPTTEGQVPMAAPERGNCRWD